MKKLSPGALLIIVVLVALLAVSGWMAVDIWTATDDAAALRSDGGGQVSGHGIIALILGGVGSIVVGGGLMALVFFSARSGHDRRVHDETAHRVEPDAGPR